MARKPSTSVPQKEFLYDILWPTKRQKKVLFGEVGDLVENFIRKECERLDLDIEHLEVMTDFIRVTVRTSSSGLSGDKIVRRLKAGTAQLRKNHASLSGMPSLWTRSHKIMPREMTRGEIRDYLMEDLAEQRPKRKGT